MVATTFDMETVLSYTTRSPRHYEKNGEDYYFVSEEQFKKMEQNDEFLKMLKSMDTITEFVSKILLMLSTAIISSI